MKETFDYCKVCDTTPGEECYCKICDDYVIDIVPETEEEKQELIKEIDNKISKIKL